MIPVGEQVRRRHDGPWVDGAAIPREPAHHRQAVGPLGGLRLAGLHRPGQGELGGDVGGAGQIGEDNKPLQQPSGQTELVAEGATSGQILVERRLQRAHDAAPGHGSAMARNAAMSTLA